jgi:PPOX class probable F420-dependent enzyme
MQTQTSALNSFELEKLREKIEGIRIAMLTTLTSDGEIHARPMATQEMEGDEIWFFTNDDSHKVDELQRNPKVHLSYTDEDSETYVCISGTAELVKDRQKINELWKDFLKTWFPKGKDDPHLALLRVTPHAAEYWDRPGGKMMTFLETVKGAITGQPDKTGRHEKLGNN